VPLVIDDSPCVSFNADDSSPILDPDGRIVGYTTVHSNGYDSDGLSIMRVDLVTLNSGTFLYFSAVNGSAAGSSAGASNRTAANVRAWIGTGLPDACPSANPFARQYGSSLAVDCNKRRATLDVSVPTSLFNCTVGTTEDFNIVFFLQIEVSLALQVRCGTGQTGGM
jgi:hypothetical protein